MNLKKLRLNFKLSICVIPSAYAIKLPDTDPLPYPDSIPFFASHSLMYVSRSIKSMAPTFSYTANSSFKREETTLRGYLSFKYLLFLYPSFIFFLNVSTGLS